MKDSIIRISITLLDVDPAIWRKIEAPASLTLEGLHDVIQIVMGWADYHLHHFQSGSVMYGAPTPDDRDMLDGRKIELAALIVDGERVFDYVYDYGDNWCCVVVLEAVAPTIPGVVYIRASSRAPGAALPRMSEVHGAMASSWRPLQTQSTSVTKNCSNGAAATSIRRSSMSTKSILASPRSKEHPPQDRKVGCWLRLTGGLHRTRTLLPPLRGFAQWNSRIFLMSGVRRG
jgi:hypothetical protein